MASTAQPVVLAFGDSLTWGKIDGDSRTGAYTDKLQQLLPGATLVNDGVPGDKAVDMMHRLRAKLNSGFKYTHVAILAGTNDLCFGTSPGVVLQTLKALYMAARDTGTTCIAITIPQFGPSDKYGYATAASRAQVNDGIRSFVQSEAAAHGGGPRLLLADFDAAFAKLPPQQRTSLFVDTVHMSRDGYDRCALTVYEAIVRSGPSERPGSPSLSFVAPPLSSRSGVVMTPAPIGMTRRPSIIHQHPLQKCRSAALFQVRSTLAPEHFAQNLPPMKGMVTVSTMKSTPPSSPVLCRSSITFAAPIMVI